MVNGQTFQKDGLSAHRQRQEGRCSRALAYKLNRLSYSSFKRADMSTLAITEKIARFSLQSACNQLPADIRDQLKKYLLDAVGSMRVFAVPMCRRCFKRCR
jgi:hypothetical protein